MTEQELAFKEFSRFYSFDWYAQPDGGNRTVIFSFIHKSAFNGNTEEVLHKFEAQSLEKAFNYAFHLSGLINFVDKDWFKNFGVIRKFNLEAWNKQVYETRFWSIQDGCWKDLNVVLANEAKNEYIQAQKRQIADFNPKGNLCINHLTEKFNEKAN